MVPTTLEGYYRSEISKIFIYYCSCYWEADILPYFSTIESLLRLVLDYLITT